MWKDNHSSKAMAPVRRILDWFHNQEAWRSEAEYIENHRKASGNHPIIGRILCALFGVWDEVTTRGIKDTWLLRYQWYRILVFLRHFTGIAIVGYIYGLYYLDEDHPSWWYDDLMDYCKHVPQSAISWNVPEDVYARRDMGGKTFWSRLAYWYFNQFVPEDVLDAHVKAWGKYS